MTLSLDTVDGIVPLDEDDDGDTLPVAVPPDLSPEMLRLMAQVQAATTEKIAAYLEAHGRGRSVQIGSHAAAGKVRSLAWARPRRRRAA